MLGVLGKNGHSKSKTTLLSTIPTIKHIKWYIFKQVGPQN